MRYPSLNSFTEALVSVAASQSGLQLVSRHAGRSVQAEMRERLKVKQLAAECAILLLVELNF